MTDSREGPSLQHAMGPAAATRPEVRVYDSADLFQGAKEVVISHNGKEYRLRRTHLGKLILTA